MIPIQMMAPQICRTSRIPASGTPVIIFNCSIELGGVNLEVFSVYAAVA